jgi:DNA-binding response OmpR family regulator
MAAPKHPPDPSAPASAPLPGDRPISVIYVEDDERLARFTQKYLQTHGLRVVIASSGRDAVAIILKERPDVVLLDLMLPGVDGLEVCRQVRTRTDTPILMVTARADEVDRVVGLESGADDYIVKPFSARELLARVRANARRGRARMEPPDTRIKLGRIVLDPMAHRVLIDGEELALTTYEFDLMHAFAEHPGRVLKREQLIDFVRGNADDAFDRSIDVHVSRLRKKLHDDPRQPQLIKTVRGIGYVFAPDEGQ